MRKANRIKPKVKNDYVLMITSDLASYTLSLWHYNDKEEKLILELDHVNFNAALVGMYNYCADHRIPLHETVFNGKQIIRYKAWPPPLSISFVNSIFFK